VHWAVAGLPPQHAVVWLALSCMAHNTRCIASLLLNWVVGLAKLWHLHVYTTTLPLAFWPYAVLLRHQQLMYMMCVYAPSWRAAET
jgi:hypothetical protein